MQQKPSNILARTIAALVFLVAGMVFLRAPAAIAKETKLGVKIEETQEGAQAATDEDLPAKIETTLPGFLAAKWGDSPADLKKALTAKGFTVDGRYGGGDLLYATCGKMGGFDVTSVTLYFLDDQFYKAVVLFSPGEERVLGQYQDTKKLLNLRFGKPKHDWYDFSRPYCIGDGFERQAIRADKAYIVSTWEFNNKPGKAVIWLWVSSNFQVNLSYEEEALTKKAIDRYNRKVARDF